MSCSPHCSCLNSCALGGRRPGRRGARLFPGQNRVSPLTPRQLNRACHAVARLAEIDPSACATALPIVPSAAWACARPSHR